MKWSILSGDVNWEDHGGKFVAGPFDNGDFQYWFVIEVFDWESMVGEREAADIDGTHNVCLSVVAPSECSADSLQSAFDSYGIDGGDMIGCPMALVDLLHGCGIRAVVHDDNGSLKGLLRLAKQEARVCESIMFGFKMDAPQNAIGSTGWDLLRGDLLAGLQLSQ
jgi:hypothetical protein